MVGGDTKKESYIQNMILACFWTEGAKGSKKS